MEPKWLTTEMVRALHGQTIAFFGGSAGMRDPGLLDSALQRARNLHAYGDDQSLFRFAASYCFGIVRNHPFVDGNNRTGLLAARAFLFRNGYLLEPDEADEVMKIVALAAGELEEAALADWLDKNSIPRPAPG